MSWVWLIQTLDQNYIVIEAHDLKPSNKKNFIHILHVDDDPSILEITKQIMVDMDSSFEFDCACCVDEAFKKLSTEHYDVVISDYEMPQKNGLQFLKELREQKNAVPFILFTGKGREEVAIRALNLGADGYHDKQGSPETVYGELSHNICLVVDRSKTKLALEESEKRYRHLMEQASDAILVHDLKGRIIDANQRACKNLGYAKGELLNLTIADIDCNAIKNSKDKLWPKVIAGETFAFESNQKRKDGSTFPVEVSLGPTTNGKETLVIGLIRDISERKKAESELKESEARHRVISGLIGDVAFSCLKSEGYNFVVDWITGAIEKVFGCSVEEIKKRGCWKFVVDPRDLPIFEEKIVGLSAGQSSTCELRVISRDDSIRWIRVFSRVEEDKKTPKSFRLFGVCEEISERKKLEAAIAEKLDALEALIGNIGAGFITISKDYRVLYANRFVKNKVGNVEGKRCYATLHDLDHICPDCGVRKVFEDGVDKDSHEYSQVGIDGKPFSVEIIATPLKDKEGNVTAALEFVVDLTEKKQMQQKLQTDEEKFKAISYSAMDAIFMFDEEDTITYWNPAAEGIFGYAEKEIVGLKVNATLVPPYHRKDHLKFTSELGKIENKQNLGGILEFPALRKDGEEFPMEISMAPLQLNHNRYFVAIARDVTDRKEAEEQLNLTMDQLVLVNEKLGVVGSLTRHDVRNKLSAATGYAYLLKKKHADQADIVDGLGKIEQAVRDSMKIFDFAKIYEQLGVEKLSYADVGKAVDEAAALFSGLTFKVVNDCHGRSVLADSFLRQMFFNFIDNTKKYGAKATTIKVYCEQEDSGGLRLVYEDDGVGISTENKPKLFKEGFSTGGSTGFGLFLIRKMMDVYGWTIIEEGEVGKGAKFVISIPASSVSGLARETSA